MNILLIDLNYTGGHHSYYLESLMSISNIQFYTLLNEKVLKTKNAFVFHKTGNKIKDIYRLRKKIKEIVYNYNIDIIHYLEGDYFLRYFGFEIPNQKDTKIVITYHHVFESKIKGFSYFIHAKKSSVLVVHTDYIKRYLQKEISNVECVDYPHFSIYEEKKETAQIQKSSIPTLLSLGGTRYNKGLDILLRALINVDKPFKLIVAGKEEDIKEKDIEEYIKTYKDKCDIRLRYIPDSEMISLLQICDIIVLPYRNSFSGASGPMTDGIWYRKMIVGPDTKSIGNIIRSYELGFTFIPENTNSLSSSIEKALARVKEGFEYSQKAELYRERLSEDTFCRSYETIYCNLIGVKYSPDAPEGQK